MLARWCATCHMHTLYMQLIGTASDLQHSSSEDLRRDIDHKLARKSYSPHIPVPLQRALRPCRRCLQRGSTSPRPRRQQLIVHTQVGQTSHWYRWDQTARYVLIDIKDHDLFTRQRGRTSVLYVEIIQGCLLQIRVGSKMPKGPYDRAQ